MGGGAASREHRASTPYVCVPCRRSFKRVASASPPPDTAPCPECASNAVRVTSKFKAPPRQKADQWDKVAALLRAGYRFESINGKYPETLAELPDFLATHQPRSIKPHDN